MSPLLTQTQTQLTHPSFTLELNIYNRESRVQYKLGGTALNAITSGDLEHRFHACILSLLSSCVLSKFTAFRQTDTEDRYSVWID